MADNPSPRWRKAPWSARDTCIRTGPIPRVHSSLPFQAMGSDEGAQPDPAPLSPSPDTSINLPLTTAVGVAIPRSASVPLSLYTEHRGAYSQNRGCEPPSTAGYIRSCKSMSYAEARFERRCRGATETTSFRPRLPEYPTTRRPLFQTQDAAAVVNRHHPFNPSFSIRG